MRRLSPRERASVAVVGAALVLALAVLLVAVPMRERTRELRVRKQELSERLDEAQRLRRELPGLKGEIAKLHGKTKELFRPDPKTVAPEVMREVARLSSDLGLRLASVQTREPEPLGPCVRHPFGMRVEAPFAPIVRLLYELEQRQGRLWVEGVEISPGPRGGNTLYGYFHLATYTVRPKGEDEEAHGTREPQ